MGRHGCRRWAGIQDVPLAQQKIFVIFSSLKSEASPTQRYLNFEYKVWHCKLFIIKQFIFSI
ncbi:hypothetical protein FY049_09025 [Acinetobacter sp. 1125_18A]